MAVGVTGLTSGTDSTDGATYTTAAFVATSGVPILFAVTITNSTETPPLTPPTIVHNGTNPPTFTLHAQKGTATGTRSVFIFKAFPSVTSGSGTCTITGGHASNQGANWSVAEFTGAVNSDSMFHATNTDDDQATGTAATLSFSALQTGSMFYGAVVLNCLVGQVAPNVGTQLHEVGHGTPSTPLSTLTATTGTALSWTSVSAQYAAWGFEIVQASAVADLRPRATVVNQAIQTASTW